jgi:nucleoside-diphosphate-sugar epimerase
MMPMILVEDLVDAAIHLATLPEASGEAYNIICDTTTEEDFLEFVYHEIGVSYTTVPMWWPIYKIFGNVVYKHIAKLNRMARDAGARPKIDISMGEYISHNYYFSNAKLKATGFQFKYQNPYLGVRQTLQWYKNKGWLENDNATYDLSAWDPEMAISPLNVEATRLAQTAPTEGDQR